MSRENADQGNMRVSVMGVLAAIYVYVTEAELRSRVTAHQRWMKKIDEGWKKWETEVYFTLILHMCQTVCDTACLQNVGSCFYTQSKKIRQTEKKTDVEMNLPPAHSRHVWQIK